MKIKQYIKPLCYFVFALLLGIILGVITSNYKLLLFSEENILTIVSMIIPLGLSGLGAVWFYFYKRKNEKKENDAIYLQSILLGIINNLNTTINAIVSVANDYVGEFHNKKVYVSRIVICKDNLIQFNFETIISVLPNIADVNNLAQIQRDFYYLFETISNYNNLVAENIYKDQGDKENANLAILSLLINILNNSIHIVEKVEKSYIDIEKELRKTKKQLLTLDSSELSKLKDEASELKDKFIEIKGGLNIQIKPKIMFIHKGVLIRYPSGKVEVIPYTVLTNFDMLDILYAQLAHFGESFAQEQILLIKEKLLEVLLSNIRFVNDNLVKDAQVENSANSTEKETTPSQQTS